MEPCTERQSKSVIVFELPFDFAQGTISYLVEINKAARVSRVEIKKVRNLSY